MNFLSKQQRTIFFAQSVLSPGFCLFLILLVPKEVSEELFPPCRATSFLCLDWESTLRSTSDEFMARTILLDFMESVSAIDILYDYIWFDSVPSFVTFSAADTPFGEVKLADLPRWMGRRNWSPLAMFRATGRGKGTVHYTVLRWLTVRSKLILDWCCCRMVAMAAKVHHGTLRNCCSLGTILRHLERCLLLHQL